MSIECDIVPLSDGVVMFQYFLYRIAFLMKYKLREPSKINFDEKTLYNVLLLTLSEQYRLVSAFDCLLPDDSSP